MRSPTVRSCAWGVTAGTDHPPAGPQGPEVVVKDHPPVAIAPQKTAAPRTQLGVRGARNGLPR